MKLEMMSFSLHCIKLGCIKNVILIKQKYSGLLIKLEKCVNNQTGLI